MPKRGESLFGRTKKTISVLVFETTKHSRIMKKRMRIGALQKVLKADYRDLGHIVYDAISAGKGETFLKDPEFLKLIESITRQNHEMERLREGIARISRARKSFEPHALPAPVGETGPEPDLPRPKRTFLGLKKKKASEELARMVAEEFSGQETEKKAKKGLFGFGKKKTEKASEAEPADAAVPTKQKRGLFGLRKKKSTPPDLPEKKQKQEKPSKAKRNLFGVKKGPAKAES